MPSRVGNLLISKTVFRGRNSASKTLREHPNLLIDEKEGENRGRPTRLEREWDKDLSKNGTPRAAR